MSLADETAGEIRAAISKSEQARALIDVVRGQADEIELEIQHWTDGSSDPRPAEAVVRLQQARVRLDEATAEFSGGEEALKTYITEALGVTASAPPSQPTTTTPTPRQPSNRDNPTGHAERPRFNPRIFDPERFAPLRRYDEAGTAEGVLYLEDGTRHSDRVIRANRGTSAFPPERIKNEFKSTTPNDGHIEGNVAAMMWKDREKLDTVTLYLNAETCTNKGQGCKENTHAFMPQGSTMNTWAQNDDGSRVFKRISGTGEAFT